MNNDAHLWHKRLGHPSDNVLSSFSKLVGSNLVWNPKDICDSCNRAKQTRSSFKINNKRSSELFALIHCDILGPYRTKSLSGAQYFLTIVDDKSRGIGLYLMHDKSEVSAWLIKLCKRVMTQFGT